MIDLNTLTSHMYHLIVKVQCKAKEGSAQDKHSVPKLFVGEKGSIAHWDISLLEYLGGVVGCECIPSGPCVVSARWRQST